MTELIITWACMVLVYFAGFIAGGRRAIAVLSRDTGKEYGPPSWADVARNLKERIPWV